jgi:hypothetical protein
MSDARFTIAPGDTVTAFAVSPVVARPFPGTPAPLPDKVDYCFVNGFTDVGDLPCRVATWDEVRSRPVPDLEEFAIAEIRLPGRGRRLDFSHFWHKPTRLVRWARTTLTPETDGAHGFRITTCGGVHIWVDGQHVAAFEPFTRNTAQTTDVTLPLRKTGSEVVLRIEEMAERDTQWFVELAWLGPGDLSASVPGGANSITLATLMDMARDVHPAQTVFGAGDHLVLTLGAPAPMAVEIRARIGQSVHLRHLPAIFSARATIAKGATQADLGPLADLPDGFHPLALTFSVGDTQAERDIAFARLGSIKPRDLPSDLSARKALALAHAATDGEPRAGRLIAMQATGAAFDATAQAILDDTLDGIVSRRDCSDFVMVPLLWLWAKGADWMPATSAAATREAILGYRYWMDEPGNDAMWFWSENHVLCFHVSEYLAGGLFPDATFTNSGLTGIEHRALAEMRLTRWFDAIESHGLAEWNSAAYYPVDFIGLFALEDLGEDEIAARARGVLDNLFQMIALHTAGGVPAGSMGRAYDKELRAGPLTELAPFAAVAFGRGWLNAGVAALPMFCAGDYCPPDGLGDLAMPETGTRIEARYIQGFGEAGRLALCKTATMQLSAAIDASPGEPGHQQHLIDIQSAADPFARVWINHPGEDDPWGAARPSYWAGNGIMPRVGMDGNTALMLFDPGDAADVGFTHAYAPLDRFDDCRTGTGWMVLASGDGWVAIRSTERLAPVLHGPGAGIEHRAYGRRMGWALAVGELAEGGIDAVARQVGAWSLTFGRDLFLTRPGMPDLTLNWSTGLGRDGAPVAFSTASRRPDITKEPLA